MEVNVDLVTNGEVQGEVATRLLTQGRMDIGRMRPWVGNDGITYVTVYTGGDPKQQSSYRAIGINANGTLRPDEWKQLDSAILGIAECRLGGIQDLISKNLVYNLGNAMGTTVLEYHDVSDAAEAVMSMDGLSRGKNDRPVFGPKYLPLPLIHVDYEINARVLAASRSLGNPLDTTMVERATRRINEKLEDMLFTDTTYAFGGGTIYSYINAPGKNEYTLDSAWDASGVTGTNIVDDVKGMKQLSIAAHRYGPWVLYIPTDYETVMDSDYNSTRGNTIRSRILEIDGITDVKVSDRLTADTVVLVQMTSDVVRLVRGTGITNVQWSKEGEFVTKYKVFTIQVPQVRSDQQGSSGITVGALAA